MKRIIRKAALAMVFALCGGFFVANAQKLGYVDLQEVMVAMPEYKKANTDMEKYQKQLEEDIKLMKDKKLFDRLDALVDEAGGRLYPAKDAHMSKEHFKRAYPGWLELEKIRDPKLLSKFWKRVAHD